MSDTPRTDKAAFMADCWQSHVPVKFAENLELECNELREIFPKILEALESGACAATCSVDFLREIPREVRLVRQRLERERDAFEKELAYVREVLLDAIPHAYGSTKKLAEMIVAERDELRKALSLAGKLCHEVHHPKSMQHGDLDPCPVEVLIQQALYKTL